MANKPADIIDELERRGPLTSDDMRSVTGRRRSAGNAYVARTFIGKFAPTGAHRGGTSGVSVRWGFQPRAVYYLYDVHDPVTVVRAWFDANPEAFSLPMQTLACVIGDYGSEWKEAWRTVKEELFDAE